MIVVDRREKWHHKYYDQEGRLSEMVGPMMATSTGFNIVIRILTMHLYITLQQDIGT